MSATANVVIIAAIITKVGPSTHDVRHQAALGLLPRGGRARLKRSEDFMARSIFSLLLAPNPFGHMGN